MEDIIAKRNARMKRILENSERRLLKITGRDNAHESNGKHDLLIFVHLYYIIIY